jgi:hypothetical protein
LNIFPNFSDDPDGAPGDGQGDGPDGDDEPVYDAPDDEQDDGPAQWQNSSWKGIGGQPIRFFSF